MFRSLLTTGALVLGVTLTSATTASASGPHHHHHHHGSHGHRGHLHGGYGYGGYGSYYGGPVIVRPNPVVVSPYQYQPVPSCHSQSYGYPGYYGGYAPSGIGFSNRNFSLWLGN